MKLKYLLLALTAAALLPVLSGCGGSDDASADVPLVPLGRYLYKADLICSDASFDQSELAGAYLEKHPKAEEADLVLPAAVPPLEKMFRQLRQLGLPREHEEEAEIYLEKAEAALEVLKEEPERALSAKGNPFTKANQLGEKLGSGDCSRNP